MGRDWTHRLSRAWKSAVVAGAAVALWACEASSDGAALDVSSELGDVDARADARSDADVGAAVDVRGETPDVADDRDVGRDGEVDGADARCGDLVCAPGEEGCAVDCGTAPVYRYDPSRGELTTFPDDLFTRPDPSTPTGLRVEMTAERIPQILEQPSNFRGVFAELSTLDGFGTTGGAYLQFSRPLDAATITFGVGSAQPGTSLIVGCLSDGAFEPTPTDGFLTDEGATVVLRPMIPLPPTSRCLAALTRDVRGADGSPIEPGRSLDALLRGEADGALEALIRRYAEAVDALVDAALIEGADDIGAMTIFTTQSIFEESRRIAADIAAREHTVAERHGCDETASFVRCTISFDAASYRGDDLVAVVEAEPAPQEMQRLLVEVYLPLAAGDFGGPPYPTVIFGHGLSSGRTQARRLADFAAPLGLATIAIDAPEHGDHPLRRSESEIGGVIDFFGLTNLEMRALVLRDNWRQAAWDKLALVDLIEDGIDVDGDGSIDVDAEKLTYLGVSLGAIMGPEFLSLTRAIDAAVLVVGGGRVTDIMQFSTLFRPLTDVLRPPGTSGGDVDRFFPLLQTAIDRGDAANWGTTLLRPNPMRERPLQLLFGMVLDDEIVPETSNLALARAIGLPHVPPILRSIPLLETAPLPPVAGNLAGGGTAGLLQFDQIFESEEWRTATHDNVGDSPVGAEAWFEFLRSWIESGVARIVDPYAELGLERP